MRTTTRAGAVVAGLAAALLAGPAHAAAPTTTSEDVPVTGVIDSCPGFDVVADGRLSSRVTTYADGRQTIHLHLTGAVSNAVTGLTGKYAEIQVDKTSPSGSTFSAGLLGKLTVPGRGTSPMYAGRVAVAADGTTTYTPHTVGVDDPVSFHQQLCAALS